MHVHRADLDVDIDAERTRPDCESDTGSTRTKTGWIAMENGLSAGAVSPTDTSAVNRSSVPSTVRVSHFLRVTTNEQAEFRARRAVRDCVIA